MDNLRSRGIDAAMKVAQVDDWPCSAVRPFIQRTATSALELNRRFAPTGLQLPFFGALMLPANGYREY